MPYVYSNGENAYIGYTEDTKPTGNSKDVLIEIDRIKDMRNVYQHDGTNWVLQFTADNKGSITDDVKDFDNTKLGNVMSQLADMSTKQITNTNNIAANTTAIANIGNASPKGTYVTLSALQTAFPTGTTGIYVVTADGGWYYWNGSTWTKGGTYQGTGIADSSIAPVKTTFIQKDSKNLLKLVNGTYTSNGITATVVDGIITLNGTASATAFINAQSDLNINTGVYWLSAFNISNADIEVRIVDVANASAIRLKAITTSINSRVSGSLPIAIVNGQVVIRVAVGTTLTNFVIKPMLSLSLPSEYEYVSYSPYKVGNSIGFEDKIVPVSAINSSMFVKSRNLFNKNTVTPGYFAAYNNGNINAMTGYNASDFIPVTPGTDFTISKALTTAIEQFAYYKADGTYLSGVSNGGVVAPKTYTVPANAYFVRLSIRDADLNSFQMVLGDEVLPYDDYGVDEIDGGFIQNRTLSLSSLPEETENSINELIKVTTITCGTSKQYTKLKDAINACINPSATNKYIIEFYGTPGVPYDVSQDFTTDDLANPDFIGLMIPSYTTLRGVGNRKDNYLTLTLGTTSTIISTINMKTTASMENMTVYGNNCRYAVHADSPDYDDAVSHVTNCHFIGHWLSYSHVFGSGFYSGTEWTFKDCVFENQTGGVGFSAHNNTKFNKPGTLIFDNCRFLTPDVNGYGVRFGTLQSKSDGTSANGMINHVKITGCKTNGILLYEENASLYGTGILFEVTGYGNDAKTATITNTDAVDYSGNIDLI